MTRVWVAWLLTAALIAVEIHKAFSRYEKNKKSWELILHALLVCALGGLIIYLGLFCLRMQVDAGASRRFGNIYRPDKSSAALPRGTIRQEKKK